MKKIFLLFFLFFNLYAYSQITTPLIKANFGLDGDLNANYFQSNQLPGNDDWFNQYSQYNGTGVIDTTGAAALNSLYLSNASSRKLPFWRTMNATPGTVINNQLLIDAVFYRDYHGSDSTMYAAGASKNGMSPADWSCPVAQSVPDKNEILDVMAHTRRAGSTAYDSLWLFGGVSIEQTTGDRYFDFELYQTDMYYDRSTRKFYNYGPDAGHTAWQFSGGMVTKVGDIIFSASYGSSTLSSIEARIWVNKASLSITPATFNWSGTFDGVDGTFGYAGILPKTTGPFYIGLESSANDWAGPFSLVRGDNSLVSTYTAGQFMEFGVNLTKLGLDPQTLLSNIGCSMPIKSLFVKSRASTSFSAQLKDFVGPINLYQDFIATAGAEFDLRCGIMGNAPLKVVKPIPTINYTWATSDGHIVGNTNGTTIIIDAPGSYILSASFQPGCPAFAKDTIIVPPFDKNCSVLQTNISDFKGVFVQNQIKLNWSVEQNEQIDYFEIQSSEDGIHFSESGRVNANDLPSSADYSFTTQFNNANFYRIKVITKDGNSFFSKIIELNNTTSTNLSVKVLPNPINNSAQIAINSSNAKNITLHIYNAIGKLLQTKNLSVPRGNSIITVPEFEKWADGVYLIKISSGEGSLVNKLVVKKKN